MGLAASNWRRLYPLLFEETQITPLTTAAPQQYACHFAITTYGRRDQLEVRLARADGREDPRVEHVVPG